MRLRIVLPKVDPEAITTPTRCVYPDCGGSKLYLGQHVAKALRDTVYQEVEVHRYQCLRCKKWPSECLGSGKGGYLQGS